MDFWGVEVKRGERCPVEPGEGKIVHLSQACLGAVKKNKGSESIYLYVAVDGKKLVLGTLSPEKFPQQQFDLVFDRNFELSHNWKNGSVCLYGYRCDNPIDKPENDFESKSEEELPVNAADSGKSKSQAKQEKSLAAKNANAAKAGSAAEKEKVKIVEPKKDMKIVEEEGSSTDEGFDDTTSSDYLTDSDEYYDTESESEEGETEDDDEDEEAPKKVEPSKKRPAESATKTPGPDKKAKLVTPQKTDAKKGSVRVATPHPSKQAGKTPGNQSKQQTPKSAGSHPCKSCNKLFNSENALESHTKAKHSAGK